MESKQENLQTTSNSNMLQQIVAKTPQQRAVDSEALVPVDKTDALMLHTQQSDLRATDAIEVAQKQQQQQTALSNSYTSDPELTVVSSVAANNFHQQTSPKGDHFPQMVLVQTNSSAAEDDSRRIVPEPLTAVKLEPDLGMTADEGDLDYDLEELQMEAQKMAGSGRARIQVAVRMRPLLRSDKDIGLQHIGQKLMMDQNQVQVQLDRGQRQGTDTNRQVFKTFKFDTVFSEQCTQQQIFEKASLSFYVQQVIGGFHSTIFAYGQTGSGKTYTMEGYKYVVHPQKPHLVIPQIPADSTEKVNEGDGLIPRCIHELFNQIEQKKKQRGIGTTGSGATGGKITVSCQFIQLYNEKVYDLLNSNHYKVSNNTRVLDGVPGLKIKTNGNGSVNIENVYQFECHDVRDAFKYFWKGLKNKVMASHRINNSSSRSHSILTFTVTQIDLKSQENIIVSKLQLVDLAGSERQSHVTNHGQIRDPQQLKEAIEINKSLFTLRQVITALTDTKQLRNMKTSKRPNDSSWIQFGGTKRMRKSKMAAMGSHQQYIPYRESKLTTILRQSLGGNSYSLMIANLTPVAQFMDENLSTLQYASRAQFISNQPKINQDPRSKLILEQREYIMKLQKQLRMANDQVKFLALGVTGSSQGYGQNKQPQEQCKECAVYIKQIQDLKLMLSQQKQIVNNLLAQDIYGSQNPNNLQISESFDVTQSARPDHSENSSVDRKNKLADMQPGSIQQMLNSSNKDYSDANQGMNQSSVSVNKSSELLKKQLQEVVDAQQKNKLDPIYSMLKKHGYRDQLIKHQEQLAEQTKKMTDQMGALLQNPNLQIDLGNQINESSQEIGTNNTSSIQTQPVKSDDFATKEPGNFDQKGGIAIQTLNVSGNVQIQNNDRLIQSIQMIKEILQSNMQLREDQLKLAEEHESVLQENYQLKIENEDLRDRLYMITKDSDYAIEYQSYLPVLDLDQALEKSESHNDINELKTLIMTYIFSLKKENRNLHKRLNDKSHHNRRYEQETLKAEMKYLPQSSSNAFTSQPYGNNNNTVVNPNNTSGILKKSDGFGYVSMDNYSRPTENDDVFKQYRDISMNISQYKHKNKVTFDQEASIFQKDVNQTNITKDSFRVLQNQSLDLKSNDAVIYDSRYLTNEMMANQKHTHNQRNDSSFDATTTRNMQSKIDQIQKHGWLLPSESLKQPAEWHNHPHLSNDASQRNYKSNNNARGGIQDLQSRSVQQMQNIKVLNFQPSQVVELPQVQVKKQKEKKKQQQHVDVGQLIYTGGGHSNSKKNSTSRRVIHGTNHFAKNTHYDSIVGNQSQMDESSFMEATARHQLSAAHISTTNSVNQKRISMEKSIRRNFMLPKNQQQPHPTSGIPLFSDSDGNLDNQFQNTLRASQHVLDRHQSTALDVPHKGTLTSALAHISNTRQFSHNPPQVRATSSGEERRVRGQANLHNKADQLVARLQADYNTGDEALRRRQHPNGNIPHVLSSKHQPAMAQKKKNNIAALLESQTHFLTEQKSGFGHSTRQQMKLPLTTNK